jgi:hypothetical protein
MFATAWSHMEQKILESIMTMTIYCSAFPVKHYILNPQTIYCPTFPLEHYRLNPQTAAYGSLGQ